MRVALFASGGDIPIAALRSLHQVADVAVLVRPGAVPGLGMTVRRFARRLVRGPAPADALTALAAELGISERSARGPHDPTLAPYLRSLRIDLGCVATFAWRLGPDVLAAAPRGIINTHASLLPRHRGPNPWFWTYHADDRETGVTVHACDDTVDTGPILGQMRWPLARGYPVVALHQDVANRGAELLREVLSRMERGQASPTPQDPSRATKARRVRPGTSMVDHDWPAERNWHFLAGMAGQFTEPLRCGGAPVRYSRVPGFELRSPLAPPGTLKAEAPGVWNLWCRDGFVRLENERE